MSDQAQWQEKLSPEQYQVTRCAATEHAFSSPLLKEKRSGKYLCVCCDSPLFSSETKYDSGSGWPSFYQSLDGATTEKTDASHGMMRSEVVCAACNAHLGHLFPDGPPPTGQRFCMNGLALNFVPE